MKVDFSFTGDKEVQEFLKQIPQKLTVQYTTGVIKNSLNKLTIPAAKSRAAALGIRDRGVLIDNIKTWVHQKGVMAGVYIRSQRFRSKWDKGHLIKALGNKGFKKFRKAEWQKEPYYAYWIEHGHKDRGGNWIPPRPFWRPAWNATKEQVMARCMDTFWKYVEKDAKRRGWKVWT